MTKIRRDAQEEISFCWSPFPEERFVLNEVEVPFIHDETRRYRADAKYNGGIAFANILNQG